MAASVNPSSRLKHRFIRLLGFCLLVPINALTFSERLYAEYASETAVKTAFLYNFFKFIDWPGKLASEHGLQLCVVGDAELSASLSVLENKMIASRAVSVKHEVSQQELRQCQIVFIGAGGLAADVVRALKGLPVVTVSDQSSFIDQGGTIGFVQIGNRLGFEINNAAANSNGVHIHAQLLKLAKRVEVGN